MSVIAWDGKTVAADRQANENNIKSMCRKIERIRGDIVGTVGDVNYGTRLVKWYRSKAAEKDFPRQKAGEDSTMVVFTPAGVFEYGPGGERVRVLDKFCAWGSGKDLAMGAMEMGADARRAVLVASKHHSECGMGVTVLMVAPPQRSR